MALPGIDEKPVAGLCGNNEGYSWGRVAKLLGILSKLENGLPMENSRFWIPP
jgi:hypothetical protein